jgi:predicted thioesterase
MWREVTDVDTATAFGSGDVPVLATPRLIAWLEAATVWVAADLLEAGETTVGTAIRVEHRRATPVGGRVEITVALASANGRRLTFAVQATDAAGSVVAAGQMERAIVDRRRFLARAPSPDVRG